MKLLISNLILIASIGNLYSQKRISDVNLYLYNHVYKNVAAFNIKYSSSKLNGAPSNTVIRNNADRAFFYEDFLPDYGFKLNMQIAKLDWKYPDSNFTLYKVYIPSFEYQNDSISLFISGLRTIPYFLLALNIKNGEIKFLSGQFFTNSIQSDFRLDPHAPNSYLEYLKFKTFKYQINNIRYVKRDKRSLYYSGYSDSEKTNITIKLSLKDIEYPILTISN